MTTIATVIVTEEKTAFMIDVTGSQDELVMFLAMKALYGLANEDEDFLTDEQMEKLGDAIEKELEGVAAAMAQVECELMSVAAAGSDLVQ